MRTFLFFFLTIGIIGYFYYQSTQEAQPNISKKQFQASYKNTKLPQTEPKNRMDTVPQTDSIEFIGTDIDSLLEPVGLQWLIETTLDSFEAGEIISQEWASQFFRPYKWDDRPFQLWSTYDNDTIPNIYYLKIDLNDDNKDELIFHFGECIATIMIIKKNSSNKWAIFDRINYQKCPLMGSCSKGDFSIDRKYKIIKILEGSNCGSAGGEDLKILYSYSPDSMKKVFSIVDGFAFLPGIPHQYLLNTSINIKSAKQLQVLANATLSFYDELEKLEQNIMLEFRRNTLYDNFTLLSSIDSCAQQAFYNQEKFSLHQKAYPIAPCAFEKELLQVAKKTPKWAGTIDSILHWEEYLRSN